jgi:hypothetical protein
MQYSNSGGMLVALVAMVLLVLLCRWVFSTGDREQRRARRLEKARSRGDYGLLVPVATVGSQAVAQQRRDVLTAAGIRCTVAEGLEPGTLAVLVFRADADRARPLVSST